MAAPSQQRRKSRLNPPKDCGTVSQMRDNTGNSVAYGKAKKRRTSTDFVSKEGTTHEGCAEEASFATQCLVPNVVCSFPREAPRNATADFEAFMAKWAPLLKSEAALVVGYDSTRTVNTLTTLVPVIRTKHVTKGTIRRTQQPAKALTNSPAADPAFTDQSSPTAGKDAMTSESVSTEERISCGLFELWEFCCAYARTRKSETHPALRKNGKATEVCDIVQKDPRNALCGVGLRLTGPCDLFAGDLKLGKRSLLTHARGFYDMPECLPVLCACRPQPFSATHNPVAAGVCKERPISPSVSHPVTACYPYSATRKIASESGLTATATVGPARGKKGFSNAMHGRRSPGTFLQALAAAAEEPIAAAAGSPPGIEPSHWVLGTWKIPADYHLCLFRDKEEEVPHAVVASAPSQGPAFAVICGTCSRDKVNPAVGRTPKAAAAPHRETATAASEQRVYAATRASMRTEHAEKVNVPVRMNTSGEEEPDSPRIRNSGRRQRNGRGQSKTEVTTGDEEENRCISGKVGSAMDGKIEGVQEEESKIATVRTRRTNSQAGIPLLLAAVLLHCQAIISAHQGGRSNKEEKSKAVLRKTVKHGHQFKQNEQRSGHPVKVAAPGSTFNVPTAAAEEQVEDSVVAEAV